MAAGAVSLRKSHDIVILSFCNIVKGQAICKIQRKPNARKNVSSILLAEASKNFAVTSEVAAAAKKNTLMTNE